MFIQISKNAPSHKQRMAAYRTFLQQRRSSSSSSLGAEPSLTFWRRNYFFKF